jgi:hypothetical protein
VLTLVNFDRVGGKFKNNRIITRAKKRFEREGGEGGGAYSSLFRKGGREKEGGIRPSPFVVPPGSAF